MKILFALLASCLPSVILPGVIFAQWVDAYIPDFKVNDDNLNSYQNYSSIGTDSSGNFVIAWYDARDNPGNDSPGRIYCQRFDKYGVPLGNNFTIGQDTTGGKITVFRDGSFAAAWVRHFKAGNELKYEYYYQRFDINGNPLNAPFKIIDSVFNQSDGGNSGISIDCDYYGNFVITFAVLRINDTAKVYFQRFDNSGNKTGLLQRVNEAFSSVETPKISLNNNGSFIIAWQDNRNGNDRYDIYMQRYNASGIKIGSNVKVNDDFDPYKDQFICGVSSDKLGYTAIAWLDYRFEPVISLFYQLYDQNGTALGENKRADACNAVYSIGGGNITMREDRKFFISWTDLSYASKEQIYGRRFASNGDPIGNPYMIPAGSPGNSIQIESNNCIFNDRVYVTWSDNQNGGGPLNFDIYCSVRGFQNPDTIIGITQSAETAENFILYNPFPNPFNPETKIRYKIRELSNGKADIKLRVFDILGNEVVTIIDNELSPGTYEVIFNGSNLASGIYFVVLEAQSVYKEYKKIILLK